MKIFCTIVALFLSVTCLAQRQCMPFFDHDFDPVEPLQSKIKLIRSSEQVSSHADQARSSLFDSSWYDVDSFDNKGYKVLSYTIKNGIQKYQCDIIYEFGTNEKPLKICESLGKGVTTFCDAFEYDTSGNIISYTHYYNGYADKTIRYIYLSYNHVIEVDTITEHIEYTCEGSMMKEAITYKAGTEPTVGEYHFDDKGNIISAKWGTHTRVYAYDEYNNKISEELSNPTGQKKRMYTARYTYDSKGNWTWRFEEDNEFSSLDGRKYRVTTRQIEYY